MLAWSEGTDNGRQKTRNHGFRRRRRRAIYWLLRSPSQTCHAKPKTQINRRRTLPASFPLVGCLPQTAWPEDFSKEIQDAVALQQIKAWQHYDRGDIRQTSTVAAISGLHCRALVMWSVRAQGWQPDCKELKKAGRTVREIDTPTEVTAIISALVICIIICLSWAVNHYRDNAHYLQSQARQNARRTEAGERGSADMGMRRRDVAALDAYAKS